MDTAHSAQAQTGGDTQIILDASASMASGDGSKEQRARELAILLLKLSVEAARPGRLWALRGVDRNRIIEAVEADRIALLPFDGTSSLTQSWPADLPAPCGVRIVVSDFLFSDDPKTLVERAMAGAAKLYLVQLLDPREIQPDVAGWTAVVDVESEERVELWLDPETIARYRKRLLALEGSYEVSCAAAGAHWVSVSAASELEQVCLDQLLPAGLLCRVTGTDS